MHREKFLCETWCILIFIRFYRLIVCTFLKYTCNACREKPQSFPQCLSKVPHQKNQALPPFDARFQRKFASPNPTLYNRKWFPSLNNSPLSLLSCLTLQGCRLLQKYFRYRPRSNAVLYIFFHF